MMKYEFDRMEKYWRSKLSSEREFYEKHIQHSEEKFQELQMQIASLVIHLEGDVTEGSASHLPTICE